MRRITVCLLGPFEVSIDGELVTTFAYAKVRALLAYLAVEPQRAHPRVELATLLWPDQSERAARANLSQALTNLRQALGEKTSERPVLISDALSVQLDPAAFEVDVTQFLAALRAADAHAHYSRRSCPSCAEHLQHALGLYRGHFLADVLTADSAVFEEWSAPQREYLLQRALGALEWLTERAEWRAAYTEALGYAQRLVALEPLLDEHQRTAMRLLALNGQPTAALSRYRQFRAMLERELELEPEEATTALFNRIRRGDLMGLQPAQPPFGVPMPPTPIVNRIHELQAICARLRDLRARSVTITGTGGIGKTRLALEAAQALRFDFEDGVFFVELAALNDAALVADAVARVLGVQERPRQPMADTLRDHLRAKHVLLILDNFEHVLTATPLLSQLLAACPALAVLVTSRAPLQIRAEQQVVLEPLADADAVGLFVRCAQAVGTDLVVDAANTAVYTAICRRLDRLPLAIELIAVRARTLSPRELLHQLDRPLQALAHGPRDVPPRHQALRHAIQWSHDLLGAQEQHAFRCLGIFVGGWSADAAQAVLGDSLAVLPILEALHQASLVQHTHGDGTRFVMLETIRAYALERLEAAGEAHALRRRHAGHFLALAEEAEPWLLGGERWGWLRRLEVDHDNLRAALVWSRHAGDAEYTVVRLARALTWFWIMTSHRHEGRGWLDQLQRQLAPAGLSAVPRTAAWAQALIGMAVIGRGARAGDVWRLLEASIAISRAIGDRRLLIRALIHLGREVANAGDYAAGRSYLDESVTLARDLGDSWSLGMSLGVAGRVAIDYGDHQRAAALYAEGVAVARHSDDQYLIAFHLEGEADVALDQGRPAEAATLYAEALGRYQALADNAGPPSCLFGLARAAAQQGQLEQADDLYRESLLQFRDVGMDIWFVALPLIGLAELAAGAQAQPSGARRAARLFGAVEALYEAAAFRVPSRFRAGYDGAIATLRAGLDDATFGAAWAEGRAMTLQRAIAFALSANA